MSETLLERIQHQAKGDHVILTAYASDVLEVINAMYAAGALAGARAMQDEIFSRYDVVTSDWRNGQFVTAEIDKSGIDPAAVAQVVTDERNGDK